MRRPHQAFAAALLLSASVARAQVRVEAFVPPASAPVAAAPAGFSPLLLSAVPGAPALAPSLNPGFAAALAPSFAAPMPVLTPAAAAPAPAAEKKVTMGDWYGRNWSLPKSDEGAAWRFRDYLFLGARLWDGSRNVPELGAGIMGTVFVHPARPHSVVKVARRGYAEAFGEFAAVDDEDALDREDHALTVLAQAGAAPRPLARLTISGRPASERERIYGRTVSQLKRAGRFGPREHALVHELLDRIAESGHVAHDLHFDNIMIGRRAGDAGDRAWVIDTTGVSEASDLATAADRKARMLAGNVVWLAFKGIGFVRPLGRLLDDALRRDAPRP